MGSSCPFCAGQATQRVRFTAWGGVIGPFFMSLRKCACCGGQFNGRTGRCVKKAIRVYTLATLVVLVVLMALAVYQVAGVKSGGGGRGVAAGGFSSLNWFNS